MAELSPLVSMMFWRGTYKEWWCPLEEEPGLDFPNSGKLVWWLVLGMSELLTCRSRAKGIGEIERLVE